MRRVVTGERLVSALSRTSVTVLKRSYVYSCELYHHNHEAEVGLNAHNITAHQP